MRASPSFAPFPNPPDCVTPAPSPWGAMLFGVQGLWKFVAYGDVAAAMNALPRAGETLNGAWTRQDLLYDSDTEALSVNPLYISKKDSESSRPLSLSLSLFLSFLSRSRVGSDCV